MFRKFIKLSLFVVLFASVAVAAEKTGAATLVVLETSLGTIKLELFDDKAPLSVENFREYVRQGFYDGLIFHRVIPGFMIQGGGMGPGLREKRATRKRVPNEASNGLKNLRGTLAMARTSDIHSATSQFFINVADNAALDHRGNSPQTFGYAVFGRVVEGMDVVDKIVKTPTTSKGMYRDVPVKDVVIVKAYEEKPE
jgi:cyclophilin family peptidyl-prolyl cis-trans isomerase